MMKKMSILLTGLALILMSAGIINDDMTFSDWDKNEDTFISRSEFIEVFKDEYVDDWNVVDDQHLDDEDFYKITYEVWDADDDELLSKKEWIRGYDYYYGNYVTDDFVAIDVDNDSYIEYKEYYDILGDTDYYAVWDVDEDTYLSENELARMIFNKWDIDSSNFIEPDEYNMFDAYYLDI